jgi:hypothetical protein
MLDYWILNCSNRQEYDLEDKRRILRKGCPNSNISVVEDLARATIQLRIRVGSV